MGRERELIEEAIAAIGAIRRRFEGIDEMESWALRSQEGTRPEHVPNSTSDFDGSVGWGELNQPGFPAQGINGLVRIARPADVHLPSSKLTMTMALAISVPSSPPSFSTSRPPATTLMWPVP